ncbi:glycosyltransferase family 2 protein [Flavobacterium franklandianum]|uniref:glycosyltransferase family 2 protein n=1 Tax=Flavobacterium franklandianum TaxID=2594430 RepID=UPI00163DC276|nr:glycosyltransferase family 2 protein [Flavobacterium franklandianum]
MPKISIITVNYNDAIGLEKTIVSVLNQTYSDFEYIVIDGNSTDGSKEVILKYQDQLTYWVSEPDKGIYNAMNKGINSAIGDYLLFMNSGDVLVDDATILKICSEKLKEDIVAFDCFLEKDNAITGRRTHIENPTLFYVYKKGFKHQSTYIKRSLFQKVGLYNESYMIAGDHEFWIRSFLNSTTTSKSYTTPIAIFQLNGISQTSTWGQEYQRIENELLPNLMTDFRLLEQLLPYQNSRILTVIINLQKIFKSISRKFN